MFLPSTLSCRNKLAAWLAIPSGYIKIAADRSGSIAIIAALVLTVTIFFAGFAVDLGLALMQKRRLQAATDMAALAAAQNPASSARIVPQLLTANGFQAARVTELTTGRYSPNRSLPVPQRYVAGMAPLNAVSLKTDLDVPLHFMRVLVPSATLTVPASAEAVSVAEAGLVAGSGLVSLNGGLLNMILGQMLGTNLSLDAVSYNGLAHANINALDFLNALATQVGLSAGTYGQLLASNVSVGAIAQAEATVLGRAGNGIAQASAITALQTIGAQASGTANVAVGTLVNASLWSNAQVGSVDPATALSASLNAFQLVSFAAQIANGTNLVHLTQAVSIPGVATVDLAMSMIEPAQGSYYALGPVGMTVHTSQVRLQLTIRLLGALSVGIVPVSVTLPVYVEVADGTATIQSIVCGATPSTDTRVGVSAISGVTNAYVGAVTPGAMTNFTQPVSVAPARLVNVANLITVTAAAQVAVQGSTQLLSFNQSQVAALTPQTISSTNMTSNLLQTLSSTLVVKVTPLPLPTIGPLLTALLSPVFAVLDGVTNQILSTLGVRVGYLDVTVPGDRCGVPALAR